MDKSKLNRRGFLLAGIAGGVAGVTAVVSKSAPEAKDATATEKAAKGEGYQLSEHVRNYYRTTRV